MVYYIKVFITFKRRKVWQYLHHTANLKLGVNLFTSITHSLYRWLMYKCYMNIRWTGKVSAQPHTIVKQICFPNGNVLFLSLFPLFKNWIHNVGWGCAEILPMNVISQCKQSFLDVLCVWNKPIRSQQSFR